MKSPFIFVRPMEDLCRIVDHKGRSIILLNFAGLPFSKSTQEIVDGALRFAVEGEKQNHSMLIAIDVTRSDSRLFTNKLLTQLNQRLRPYVKRKAIVGAPSVNFGIRNLINTLRNSPTRFFADREHAFAYLTSL